LLWVPWLPAKQNSSFYSPHLPPPTPPKLIHSWTSKKSFKNLHWKLTSWELAQNCNCLLWGQWSFRGKIWLQTKKKLFLCEIYWNWVELWHLWCDELLKSYSYWNLNSMNSFLQGHLRTKFFKYLMNIVLNLLIIINSHKLLRKSIQPKCTIANYRILLNLWMDEKSNFNI
jgi:hypothetical protein